MSDLSTKVPKMPKLAVASAVLLFSIVLAAVDLSGVWTLSWDPDFGGNQDAYDCTFKQTGRVLTVICREDPPIVGEVDDQKVTLRLSTGKDGHEVATLTGEVDARGTTITGTWHLSEQNRDGKFVARKQ